MSPLSEADQVALHRKHRTRALDIIAARIQAHREHLFNLSERRLGNGYAYFGEKMFHKPTDDLLDETDEEIADAINYIVAMIERGEQAQRLALARAAKAAGRA